MQQIYEDPFDNNATQAQLSTDKLFSYIYMIRSKMPSNQIFYLIFFFLKFNVAYMATNNINGKEDNIFSLYDIFRYITVFGNNFCIFKQFYSVLCLILFIIFLFLFFLLFISFKQFIKNKSCSSVIIGLSYILMLLSFFSHYITEIITPGILAYTFKKNNEKDSTFNDMKCKEDFLNNIINEKFLPRYILCPMNCITFIMMNFILYLFLIFMNAPTRSFKHGNLNFNYKKVSLSTYTTYILQGFITSSKLYGKKTEDIIRLTICILMVVLLLVETVSRHQTFNYYALNFPLKYTVFASNASLFSGIVEIGLYFLYDSDNLPTVYYILKIIIVIVNSLLTSFYFFSSLDIFFVNELIAKIFLEKSKMTPGDLAMYDLLLYNYLNDKCDFGELYHIYHTHKVKCTTPKCPCKLLEIDKWIDKEAITEDNQHYLSVKLNNKKEEFKISSITDFIEIAEYEIRKNILLFKKDKGDMHFKQDLLILLHLDIIYLLKKDNCIAMYFCDRYRALSKKINFVTKYYLYEYKILISKELASIDKISSIDRQMNEKREMTRQMKEFYHYAEFMEKIKKMIVNCVFALETILKYKKNQIMKGINIKSIFSCDQFLKLSGSIQNTNRLLTSSLKEYLKKKEPDNPELCILVCYYYLMLNQKPPKKMIRKLDEIFSKSKNKKITKGVLTNTEANSNDDYISNLAYDNINISNPMIVILNSEDNFIIIHITMKMCSILKEGKREILNNDLHNYLPKDIVKMHKIIMKQFLLNSSVQFIKDTFIINKLNQLIPIKIVCNPLNTLETNFGLVINFIEIPTKPNLYYDYYFLLDSEFKFLGLNELFTQEYFFSLQMMKVIHLDFCSFFGIKAEKLNLKLRNYFIKNKLTQKNEQLEECNKEMSVFTCNKMENLFSKAKLNVGRKHSPLKVKEKLNKKDVINNIIQLQNNFNNFGLDVEWYSRLNYFRDRLMMGIENNTNNNNDLTKERSFLNFFESYYTINSIGNFYYIIVNLREILNNSKENQAEWNKQYIEIEGSRARTDLEISKDEKKDIQCEEFKIQKKNKFKTTLNFAIVENPNLSGNDLNSNSSKANLLNSLNDNKKNNYFRHQALKSKAVTYFPSPKNEMKKKAAKKISSSKDKKQDSIVLEKKKKEENNEENLVVESRTLFNNKKLYSIMNYVWRVLIVLEIFFCFLWEIFNRNDFQTAFDLFYINLYTTNIQTDIFYSSLSVFARCGIYGELTTEENTEEIERMEQISNELREHSKLFIAYINNQAHKKELEQIYNVLNSVEEIKTLLPNKKEEVSISSFFEELSLYQFKIFQIANYGSFDQCSLEDYEDEDTANEVIREIYYIINNVVTVLSQKFSEIKEDSNQIFFEHITNSRRTLISYILGSIVIEILLMILMQYIMSDHKANIQILLNQIYAPNKNDSLFEEDLYNYKELLFSFTKESYVHFRSMHRKILTNEKNDDMFHNNFNTLGSNESFSEGTVSNTDNNDNLRKSNNNIINDSATSSDIIFKFSDKATIPKHYCITIIIMYIAGSVFILIEIIHLIIVISIYKDLSTSNTIALNFISLIPALLEIVLYSRVSVIVNDVNYVQYPLDEFNQKDSFFNYYGANFKDSSHVINKFGESKFSFLYYTITQIRNNLKTFIAKRQDNILPNVQISYKDFSLNGNNFCIYSSLNYYYYQTSEQLIEVNNTIQEVTNAFSYISSIGNKCRTYGGGLNLNNLDTILDATLLKLENVYDEFNNIDPSIRDISIFMNDENLKLIENNIKGQLKYVYNSYVYYTIIDMNKLVKKTKNLELIFSFCLLLSITSYTLIVLTLLKVSNKNITVLIYIKMFMEQALNSKG